MKKVIYVLLTVTCCFILSKQTEAQSVYGDSWIEYDDLTNTVRDVAYSSPDYSVDVYYCVEVQMTVNKDNEYLGSDGATNFNQSGWGNMCAGNAWVELVYPYDPNSTYFLETSHTISNVQVPQQTAYNDPYGFYTYLNGDPVFFPLYYQFSGTGYPSGQSINSILLGITFSILQGGITSGPPHHLMVWDDVSTIGGCAQEYRAITYRIVDASGHPPGEFR